MRFRKRRKREVAEWSNSKGRCRSRSASIQLATEYPEFTLEKLNVGQNNTSS